MEKFGKDLIDLLVSPRFKSFYWSIGVMALTGFLSLLADNIGLLHLSPQATVILGLILNQVTKGLNNQAQGKSFGLSSKEESAKA
jgi:hypothetical protein